MGASVAAYLVLTGAAAIAVTVVVNLAISFVIGAVTRSQTKKPSSPSLAATIAERMATVRSPISPRRVVFGETRVAGTMTFLHSGDDVFGNKMFHSMVLTFTGHEVKSISDTYFNDEIVTFDSNGVATGKWTGHAWRQKTLGAASQAAFSDLMARLPTLWTANHRQRGCAGMYLAITPDQNVYPGGIPNVTVVMQGYNQVYDPRTATTGYSNNPALLVAAYLTNTTFGYGVTYATGINEAALIAAANVCDERVSMVYQPTWTVSGGSPFVATSTIAFAADNNQISTAEAVKLTTSGTLPAPLVVGTVYYLITTGAATGKLAETRALALAGTAINLTDAGTGTHTLERCATFLADPVADMLTYDTAEKKIFTGDGVRAESSGTLPAPLLGATTYYAIRVSETTVKLATTYANAHAGTAIDITTEGTGTRVLKLYDMPRYTCNGTFMTSEEPLEIIAKLCSSMAGRAAKIGATWHVVAGAYVAPSTPALTTAELRGAVDIMPLAPWRETVNGIKGVFVSPENHWQAADFPPIVGDQFLSDDGGRRAWKDIELPFTTRTTMAMRIAKIDLGRSRVPMRLTLPCRLSAYRFQPLDTITFPWGRFGFSSQVFEVLNGKFVVYPDDNGAPALGYDLIVQQTAADIFDWAASEGRELREPPATDFPTIERLRAIVPKNVAGLEIFGQGSDTVFSGRHCKFVCRRQSNFAPEMGGEQFGAGAMVEDMLQPVLQVIVYEADGVTVRRDTEPFQQDPEYIYTYEKNAEDGDGTPAREFTAAMWWVTKYGQRSPIPAVLRVSNAAPTITTLTITPTFNTVGVAYPKPADLDWNGLRFYLSTSNGFTPGAANLVYDGVDTGFTIPGLAESTTYYYRYALSDAFGYGATSAQSSFATTANPATAAAAAAAAAQATANTASSDATNALGQLTNIASDNILSQVEKPSVIQDNTVILAEQAGIDAKATAYGITTEKTAYDAAVTALTTYLATLTITVLWSDLSGNTTIVGTTFRSKFSDVYTTRQTLLNAIYAAAKVLADAAQSQANTATANAATAQSTANTAASNATAALADLANIASDSILSPVEKPTIIRENTVILAEQSGIDTQATAYSITTEKTAYDSAVSALTTYLATLTTPVLWSDVSGNTTIVGTTFRSKFADVYTTRQTLLTKIAAVAGTLATWATVTGTGKPADNADVTAANTAAAIAGQGDLATLDVVTPSEIDVSIVSDITPDLGDITAGSIRGVNVNAASHTTKGSYLTSAASAADATLNVRNTSDFVIVGSPSIGYGWIIDTTNDRDAFTYTGKTATTLTGCSGVLAHNNGATIVPQIKNMVIDAITNQMRFFGDRGDGTIEELGSIGIGSTYGDVVAQFGNANSGNTRIGLVGVTYSVSGVIGQSNQGAGIVGQSTSSTGVQGLSSSGYGGDFSGNATKGNLMLAPLAAKPSGLADGSYAVLYTTGGSAGARTATPRLCYADGINWRFVSDDSIFAG